MAVEPREGEGVSHTHTHTYTHTHTHTHTHTRTLIEKYIVIKLVLCWIIKNTRLEIPHLIFPTDTHYR